MQSSSPRPIRQCPAESEHEQHIQHGVEHGAAHRGHQRDAHPCANRENAVRRVHEQHAGHHTHRLRIRHRLVERLARAPKRRQRALDNVLSPMSSPPPCSIFLTASRLRAKQVSRLRGGGVQQGSAQSTRGEDDGRPIDGPARQRRRCARRSPCRSARRSARRSAHRMRGGPARVSGGLGYSYRSRPSQQSRIGSLWVRGVHMHTLAHIGGRVSGVEELKARRSSESGRRLSRMTTCLANRVGRLSTSPCYAQSYPPDVDNCICYAQSYPLNVDNSTFLST